MSPSPADALSSSRNLTLPQIDSAHRLRWPELESALGYWVGYNIVIFPDGSFVQTRLVGEETAAATGSNFDTMHICLVGNFTKGGVDAPTYEQISTLRQIEKAAIAGFPTSSPINGSFVRIASNTALSFSAFAIYPHRVLQPNHTDCNGTALPNSWARDLVIDDMIRASAFPVMADALNRIKAYLSTLAFGRNVGGSDRSDCGGFTYL